MKSPFPNFPSYRPYQEDTIDKIIASRKKVVFLSAPCGSGKSIIAMVSAFNFHRSLYLTTTKSLQEQVARDFPFPVLWGRANYPCTMSRATEARFPEVSCEDCIEDENRAEVSQDEPGEAIGVSCKRRCPYQQAKKTAVASNLAILNTSYYLTECNFVGKFKDREFVVVDEVDLLENAILNFVELNVSDAMLERLNLPTPQFKTKWESWKEWATIITPKLLDQIDELGERITIRSRSDEIKHYRRVKALLSKVLIFKDLLDDSWIYQEFKHESRGVRYSFKPTWISEMAHQYFWDHAQRFLVMSGTPPLPRTLGLEQEEWEWIEVPSQFPRKSRPVYYLGSANLTNKTMAQEVEKIIPPITKILEKYPTSKGLIHTVSYNLCQYVLTHVKSDRLVTHGPGMKEKESLLERFRYSQDPLVLVSPSMERGVSLDYDLCRFVIIVKVPYPDLSDKQVNKRLYSSAYGQVWYRGEAVRSIIQGSMRGMRAIDDTCDCYILDYNFENLYSKCHDQFPAWWRESLEIGGL